MLGHTNVEEAKDRFPNLTPLLLYVYTSSGSINEGPEHLLHYRQTFVSMPDTKSWRLIWHNRPKMTTRATLSRAMQQLAERPKQYEKQLDGLWLFSLWSTRMERHLILWEGGPRGNNNDVSLPEVGLTSIMVQTLMLKLNSERTAAFKFNPEPARCLQWHFHCRVFCPLCGSPTLSSPAFYGTGGSFLTKLCAWRPALPLKLSLTSWRARHYVILLQASQGPSFSSEYTGRKVLYLISHSGTLFDSCSDACNLGKQ
jgi:hypothetical protein